MGNTLNNNPVSRQMVKDIICSGVSIDTDADKEYVCELIDKLPPVIPKEKTGRWETTTTKFCGRTFEVIECSCCKVKQEWFAKTKFCPNCGAKMQEVEHGSYSM